MSGYYAFLEFVMFLLFDISSLNLLYMYIQLINTDAQTIEIVSTSMPLIIPYLPWKLIWVV